jgi:HEAT repeat protein
MIDDKIVRDLTDVNPVTRIQAIVSLRKLNLDQAAEILVSMLESENTNLRQSIISTILEIGKPAIPHLVDALRYPNKIVQTSAAKILSEIADASISTDILNILKDERGQARVVAIEVLSGLKDFWSLEYIREFLSDSDPNVRTAAARALGNLEDKLSIDLLLSLLTDSSESVRITTAEALSNFNETRVCDALWQTGLNDESPNVRNSAMYALKKIGEMLIKPYEKNLASTNVELRTKALHELSTIGKPVLLPLLDFTRHHNPAVREICIEILGNIGDRSAAQRLIELTNDLEQSVRLAAINVLGKIKTETTIRYLITCLQSPDHLVITAASEALINHGKEIVNYLPVLFADPDMNKQVIISRLIAKIGDSSIVPFIAQNLKDERMWVRRSACFALGEMKTSIAVNLLLEYGLKDKETLVRIAAVKSLGNLKMSIAIESLLKVMQEDEEELVIIAAIEALANIGDPTVIQYFEHYLHLKSISLKISAIKGLAQLRHVKSLPVLKKIAKPWPFSNEPEDVKNEARLAIKKLLFETQFNNIQ